MQQVLFHGSVGGFRLACKDACSNVLMLLQGILNDLFFADHLSELQHEHRQLVLIDQSGEFFVSSHGNNRLVKGAVVHHKG